jgi:diguanylate cyclase (GGDEF)-like protein
LYSWEARAASLLQALRLESIRKKILAFAILATLIPSVSTTWLSYRHNREALSEKISETLRSNSAQNAREIDIWLKERLLDLRVFAGSYEVSENLERAAGRGAAQPRLQNYLRSVQGRFPDYLRLTVVDPSGRPIAGSIRPTPAPELPAEWQADLRSGTHSLGRIRPDSGRSVIDVVVPIANTAGRSLGALAATLDLQPVRATLTRSTTPGAERVHLVDMQGRILLTADGESGTETQLPAPSMEALQRPGAGAVEYESLNGLQVLGVATALSGTPWLVVAELPARTAFARINSQRNMTILAVLALLAGVGLLAYFLGLLIVRPLTRLTQGADQVAGGNLDVDLPITGSDELARLTGVFNHMVGKVRESRDALERLSLTDGLTGLYNRRHLAATIAEELARARRQEKPCALVMLDVDHFKKYNDTHGHLAGDEVLVRVAKVIKEAIRVMDRAVRYGGEEILVLLPDTDLDGAAEVGERIRGRLAEEFFAGGRVTVSIGVAVFPEHGESPEALIMSADAALYEAKHCGRDRVVRAALERA